VTLIDRPKLMTTEEFEALPDDGRERWLIDGVLWEGEQHVTTRNQGHSRIEAKFCTRLQTWSDAQPEPRGAVLVGEAGVRLRRDSDTIVGIDVGYISAQTVADNPDENALIDGVPLLVIEILSPSDTQKSIGKKIQACLACGVPHVWMASVEFRTVTAYRPGAEPQLFSVSHTISAEPHLPGLRIALADIFGR
jgi:Uma2 family endonuclease